MPHWLSGVVALLAVRFSVAAGKDITSPPKFPEMDHLPATLRYEPIGKITMGTLSVELEHTTLAEVRKAAGAGVVRHRGDAGESESWLCYTLSADSPPTRIWLLSGELGGPEHSIGSVYAVAPDVRVRASIDCPGLPARLLPISLHTSLRLGSTSAHLTSAFGQPSAKRNGWWLYSYSGKVLSDKFDRLTILGARLSSKGKIIAIFVSQTTTN